MKSVGELEQEALQRLQGGDLEGARAALLQLSKLRPQDTRLAARILVLDQHLAKRRASDPMA
ncbi:MAG: hypothetical protein HC923_00865, partial [Myxococcales bacterium]|nr:hypothetical protein [Myxococcales bacterium]